MTLNLELDGDFLDADEQKLHQFANSRLERISPWVETIKEGLGRTQQLKNGPTPQQYNEQNKKKIDFLATLNKQIEVKRRRFRTMVQRAESTDKQTEFQELSHLPLNFSSKKDMKKDAQANALRKSNHKLEMGGKGKKVLSTTMYVYESHQPRRMSKLCRTTRAISFGYEPLRKEKSEIISERQEGESFYGSKNLQRILKMKQKIRVKNSYVVRKIKEKKIESDKIMTEKYLSELHSLQRWKSITLDSEKSHKRPEGQKFKPANTNFKIPERSFNLKRATTTKFFN